jgi:hypothetical protein
MLCGVSVLRDAWRGTREGGWSGDCSERHAALDEGEGEGRRGIMSAWHDSILTSSESTRPDIWNISCPFLLLSLSLSFPFYLSPFFTVGRSLYVHFNFNSKLTFSSFTVIALLPKAILSSHPVLFY